MADIEKLRKLALLGAILLFSFSAAGIQLDADSKATIFGIPFKISSPELLPVGLIVLSVYGMVRYYYYAIMLSASPYRQRRDILHTFHAEGGYGTYKGSVYSGPSNFSSTPLVRDRKDLEPQLAALMALFPKIGTVRPSGAIKPVELTGLIPYMN